MNINTKLISLLERGLLETKSVPHAPEAKIKAVLLAVWLSDQPNVKVAFKRDSAAQAVPLTGMQIYGK